MTKFGYYLPWIVVSAAFTAIGAGLISTWQPSTGLGKLLGYQILFGSRGAGMQMVRLKLVIIFIYNLSTNPFYRA